MGNIVIIKVRRGKTFFGQLLAPPPLASQTKPHTVHDKPELAKALKTVKDGDVLILTTHSNYDTFEIGKNKDKVAWKNLWKEAGVTRPPRLDAVFIAGCMTPQGELPRAKLREIRRSLRTNIAVATETLYRDDDLPVAEKIMSDLLQYRDGKITGSQFYNRFCDQKNFAVTFGCNGWNHPDNCRCGFGVRKKP